MFAQESEQREALLRRIHELETASGSSEKREAAKARKKLLKDLQALLEDAAVPEEKKVTWLQSKVLELVRQGKAHTVCRRAGFADVGHSAPLMVVCGPPNR